MGAFAQDRESAPSSTSLSRLLFRSGEGTLKAFGPVSVATRPSIVKLNVNGSTACLATVVDASGLALTKASEVKAGKLTCWLPGGKEVKAELLGTDETLDLALIRVQARGLKAVQWVEREPVLGQWAISPGIAETPQAVGIVSALPRKIRPERAFIGVQFESGTTVPKVEELMSGLGAEKAGIRPGDIILAVNGEKVKDRQEVAETLREIPQGHTVKLRVQRPNQDEFDVDVRLMAGPETLRSSSALERGGRMMGAVSDRSAGFEQVIEHDSVLQPWVCGGPLVDLDGKCMGINIARADRAATYALPSKIVQKAFQQLKAGAKLK